MSKQISFLLGSGFSAPDGTRTVGQINAEIQKLTVDDIYIHTDMTIILLNGQPKPPRSFSNFEEIFFIDFIKFYSDLTKKSFHYEEFYDFVISYERFGNNKAEIEAFVSEFNKQIETPVFRMDASNNLSRFSDRFSKIISSLLQSKKYYEDIGLGNYPPYDSFIAYLRYLIIEKNIVNVHSLNHDLLFEHIASKHTYLWKEFTDGFDDLGSNYYGEVNLSQSINKNYKVRLKCFQDKFDKPLQLLKLHGSVDRYIANIYSSDLDLTRVKKDWGVGKIIKEIHDNETGKPKYAETDQFSYPDILSGATSKAMWYKQPFYKEQIEKFICNLHKSEKLIVIGYGFKDDGINHLLETEFLVNGKLMIVVDVSKPNSRLVNDYKVNFINKSVTELNIKEWTDL